MTDSTTNNTPPPPPPNTATPQKGTRSLRRITRVQWVLVALCVVAVASKIVGIPLLNILSIAALPLFFVLIIKAIMILVQGIKRKENLVGVLINSSNHGAGAVLFMGGFFKIMGWPGAGVMLIQGFTVFAMFFFLQSFYHLAVLLKEKRKVLAVVKWLTYFFIAIALMGILFKTQRWPGATVQLYAGLFPLLLLIAAGIYFYLNANGWDKPGWIKVLQPGGIVLAVGLFMVFVPNYVQYSWYGSASIDPHFMTLYKQCEMEGDCELYYKYSTLKGWDDRYQDLLFMCQKKGQCEEYYSYIDSFRVRVETDPMLEDLYSKRTRR